MLRTISMALAALCLFGADAAAQTLYWTDVGTGKIQRAEIGGPVEDLVLNQNHSKLGFAADFDGGTLHWAHKDGSTWRIRRADLDGTGQTNLIPIGSRDIDGIAVDSTGGKIYWGEFESQGLLASRIRSAELDGSQVSTLVPGLADPVGIALDTAAGKIYWADPIFVHRIQRADIGGGNVETIVSDTVLPFGIALDTAAGKIYWADFELGEIHRADLDGTNAEPLVTGLDEPRGVALDPGSGKLYWTRVGAIERADLDGTNIETLFSTGLVTPAGIALDLDTAPLQLDVDGEGLSWGPAASALSFDLVRGTLGALRSSGDFTAAGVTCLAFDLTDASIDFTEQPASGQAFWFLARRETAAGNQTYDTGSPSQATPRDPSITASGNDCP